MILVTYSCFIETAGWQEHRTCWRGEELGMLRSGRTWNAKCPIFLGNFTHQTSNYCLKNRALGLWKVLIDVCFTCCFCDPVAPVNPFLHLPECQLHNQRPCVETLYVLILVMGHSPTRALTFKTQESGFCMVWFPANKSRRPPSVHLMRFPLFAFSKNLSSNNFPSIFDQFPEKSSNSCDCPTPFIHLLPETGRPFQPKCKVYNTVMKVVFITATCCWRFQKYLYTYIHISWCHALKLHKWISDLMWHMDARNFELHQMSLIVIIGKPVWRCTSLHGFLQRLWCHVFHAATGTHFVPLPPHLFWDAAHLFRRSKILDVSTPVDCHEQTSAGF